MNNNIDLLKKKYSKDSAGKLIITLANSIMNFKGTFKGNLNNTFILSFSVSSNFGVDIDPSLKCPVIGVPEYLFQDFSGVFWKEVCIDYKKGGLYFIFEIPNSPSKNNVFAFKAPVRKKILMSLDKFDKIFFTSMDSKNCYSPINRLNSFSLPIKRIDDIWWE